MTKEQKLIEAIQKACPDIMNLEFGCNIRTGMQRNDGIDIIINYLKETDTVYCESGWEFFGKQVKILGRDITLADVLRAYDKVKHIRIPQRIEDISELILDYWDLTKNLQDQSDEVKEFLYKLIVR